MVFGRSRGYRRGRKILIIKAIVIVGVLFAVIGVWFHHELTRMPPTPAVFITGRDTAIDETTFYNTTLVRYGTNAIVKPLEAINGTVKVGISTDSDKIDWGIIPQGVEVGKIINLDNSRPVDAKIDILVYGNVTPFITIGGGNSFILKSGEGRSIEIAFKAEEIGEYSGEIDIYVRVPKNWLVGSFLDYA